MGGRVYRQQKQVQTVGKEENERKYISHVKWTVFEHLVKSENKGWMRSTNMGVRV